MICGCDARLTAIESEIARIKSQLTDLDKFTGMTSFAKHIKSAQDEIQKAGKP